MDLSLVGTALTSINAAISLGRGAVALRDDAKAQEIVGAMNEQLLDAQQRLFELSAALLALQQEHFETAQELRELREALAERDRYSLFRLPNGQFAYRVNGTPALGGAADPTLSEPDHYICQQCFDGGGKHKVVLQRRFRVGAGSYHLECPACKITLAAPD